MDSTDINGVSGDLCSMEKSTTENEQNSWQVCAPRPTGDELDEYREKQIVYNYLCRLEEARQWMSSCINDEIPAVTEGMEESLTNGVVLAKLAKFIVPEKRFRIYDEDLRNWFLLNIFNRIFVFIIHRYCRLHQILTSVRTNKQLLQ
jgi:hypothetical protein